jgi:hypothetical protein
MGDSLSYLMELLDNTVNPWAEKLRPVLVLAKATRIPVNLQHCTADFSLTQALRRLATSRALEKKTFGIESLIEELRLLARDVVLKYYVISTDNYLGTCYVLRERLLGCEFVVKSGTKEKPGLWLDDKPGT